MWDARDLYCESYEYKCGVHGFEKLLTLHGKLPDAIICANNYIAMGCVDALCRKNIRIPQDIGIVAFDDYPLSQVIEPQLTIVDINVRDLGRQAGKLIIDIIKHPNKQIQTYVTTSNIVERKSTRRTKQT